MQQILEKDLRQKTAKLSIHEIVIADLKQQIVELSIENTRLAINMNDQLSENYKLKAQVEMLENFAILVDIYEGEVIDGARCEADALIELGELSREKLEELKQMRGKNE